MTTKCAGFAALVAAGLMLSAQAAPISYGGHYYDYVNFAVAVTWDQAKTQAEGLSYSGLGGHLATFTSQAEFDAVKSVMDYNTWSMAWVGARDSGSGFTWVQGEGAVNFGAWGSWAAGEPGAGEYGMTLWGPSYGYTFGAEAVGSTGIGQMMVEYDVVPEPTGMALLALGCAAAALRRRVSKKA